MSCLPTFNHWAVSFCVSRLEGREAGAKHRAEGEPVRWRPRRGHAQIIKKSVF